MRSPYDVAFDEEEKRRRMEELEELRYCDGCKTYLTKGYYNINDMWFCADCAEEWLDKQWEDLD